MRTKISFPSQSHIFFVCGRADESQTSENGNVGMLTFSDRSNRHFSSSPLPCHCRSSFERSFPIFASVSLSPRNGSCALKICHERTESHIPFSVHAFEKTSYRNKNSFLNPQICKSLQKLWGGYRLYRPRRFISISFPLAPVIAISIFRSSHFRWAYSTSHLPKRKDGACLSCMIPILGVAAPIFRK